MIPPDQLSAIKDRHPVAAIAADYVKLRAMRAGRFVGPCPICSDDPQSKTASRFECDADKWVCAVCADGGDVIKLVCKREGIDFVMAVERLGGARAEDATPALAMRAGRRAFRADLACIVPSPFAERDDLRAAYTQGWGKGKRAVDYEAFARDRERRRLYEFWRAGTPITDTPVAAYHAARGLRLPANARLKYHPDMPLFCDGREHEPLLAHRGPAQLAAIIAAAGEFAGLHITWLDPSGPKGKAHVAHPETGELLPAKKVRGSKAGGFIDLGGCTPDEADRVIAGEGIETVGAVYTALARRRDVSRVHFRSGIDLGNLAGRALATIAHPTAKTESGRAQRVPGPDPDLNSPAMPVPDAVPELVLLGDGDSDPFLTRNAMHRARRRHERPGRAVRVVFGANGLDFEDHMKARR